MISVVFYSRALCIGLAAALLAACGGTQSGTQGALPLSAIPEGQARAQGHSWISPGAKSGDLIYATGGCGGTCVLSYPDGKLVGQLAYSGYANCSDAKGNVYIPTSTNVVEFAHGGVTPIAIYTLPYSPGSGCAVDPSSGNLAVVNSVFVSVFPTGSANPTTYDTEMDAQYCGYDDSGNLFVSGFNGGDYALSELPNGGSTFQELMLDQSVGSPGQVQWDGHHLTYESQEKGQPKISRLSISGSAVQVIGKTHLKRVRNAVSLSWIYQGSVIAPYTVSGAARKNIGIWKYPGGGRTKRITSFGTFDKNTFNFTAATISVAP